MTFSRMVLSSPLVAVVASLVLVVRLSAIDVASVNDIPSSAARSSRADATAARCEACPLGRRASLVSHARGSSQLGDRRRQLSLGADAPRLRDHVSTPRAADHVATRTA